MSNSLRELVSDSAKGSVVLFVGQVITTIISALTMIWIAREIGSVSYGVYTVVFVPVKMALLVQSLGVNAALTRFCALYRREGRVDELGSVILTGLVFSIGTSALLSGALYLFSGPISSEFLRRPELDTLLKAAALSVLGNSVLLTAQAIMVGYERMELRVSSQIIYSVLHSVLSVGLVLAGLNVFGATVAHAAALVVGALASVLLLSLLVKTGYSRRWISWGSLKTLLRYGFPLSVGGLLGAGLSQVYNGLMVTYIPTGLIGNYSAAMNFAVLVQFFTIPLGTSLFPLFSKFDKGDPKLGTIYRLAVKFTSIIVLPVVFAILVLSKPLSGIVYGSDYSFVAQFLGLYMISFTFEGLGGLSMSNLISGIGAVKTVLRTNIIMLVCGAAFASFLVPRYQIFGVVASVNLTQVVTWAYQTYWLRANTGLTIDWRSSTRIYAATFAALASSYFVVNFLGSQPWAALVLGGLAYLSVYVVGLRVGGAVTKRDLDQLETFADILGPLSGIARFILKVFGQLYG